MDSDRRLGIGGGDREKLLFLRRIHRPDPVKGNYQWHRKSCSRMDGLIRASPERTCAPQPPLVSVCIRHGRLLPEMCTQVAGFVVVRSQPCISDKLPQEVVQDGGTRSGY